jgi:DNA-binding transcriptional MocR family regulator
VTSGSQQALDLLARAVVDPGDPVVVEDPAYVGALQVFQAAGADLHTVPLDAEGMDLDALEALLRGGLRPRLVHTVSSFHNPRGVTMSQARRARLAELADRHGLLVVEDDPYGPLAFDDGAPPRPVTAYGDRVVRLGSASKILAPALRVGWLTGPAPVVAAVERLRQCADLCGSTLTHAIAAELLADGPWLAGHLHRLRTDGAARARVFTAAVDSAFGSAVVRSEARGRDVLLARVPRRHRYRRPPAACARPRRRVRAGQRLLRLPAADRCGSLLLRHPVGGRPPGGGGPAGWRVARPGGAATFGVGVSGQGAGRQFRAASSCSTRSSGRAPSPRSAAVTASRRILLNRA